VKEADRNTGSRGRLAEELERQKQYFESLLEISPVAIVTTDLDGSVTSWNPEAERLFGYSRDEAIGHNLDDLIAGPKDLRDEAAAVKTEAAQTGRFHGITRRTRKDGTLVDVEVLAVPVVVDRERAGYYAIYHDVSELQRQKRYFESLIELSPSAIATVDADANVTSWNPAAERLFGYTAAEAIGRNIDELVTQDERLRAEALEVSRRGTSGEQAQLVTQRQRKDGSFVDVQLVAAPILVGGEQVGFYAIYNDVSELQRQKQYYVSLLESSPSAIVTLDLDSTVRTWNRAAEELFGYARDEAIGRDIDELIANHPDIHEEAEAMTREGAERGRSRLVTRRMRKDGSLVDVDVVGARIDIDGDPVGLYAIYSDVSELQRQRRYYEALFELSPTAIATVDRDLNITSWNAAAERLFGYAREEAVGRTLNDLVAPTDELRAEGMQLDRETEEGEIRRTTRRMRKDGSVVDVDLLAAPMVVAGETVGLFVLYHDISDLQRARREAEAATEAKSAFLATMSHEIRTPMNAVIGMTELLLGTQLDAEQRGFGEVIRTSGEALLSVINDILDFSKIEAGRLDLERHPFDLRECVESAMEVVAPAAAEKALDLAYLLASAAPEALVGDAARLRQILLNLLNNAVKFTERGEIVLTVDAQPLADDESGRYRVQFSVRDTGIGIPADRLETLFESFTQLDASTTRRYGGTGLGLAISRRLAEAMGGTIWAESRVGEGSTFHFTVDADEAPRPLRPYEAETVALLEGRRVLIVDDNATNRQIARAYIESWRMVARDTASPREAVEWVRRGDPFDAAILDMHMPELDGVAVAEEIRRYRSAERLPLILLTSLGRREEASGGVLFAAHLTKPIRPSQLYDAFQDALGLQIPATAAGDAHEAPADRAPGRLRILLAEDNAVNQQLALAMLEKLGYGGEVASNGLEALAALERRRYDVVLMDVQMPELDGLEATRRIHERWGSERPHIIAVTAGAMSEEREQCLAAGMDDYLSKPIRIEELSAALASLGPATAGSNRRATPPEPSPGPALDPAVLSRLRATLGDGTTAEIVETFLTEGPQLLSVLRRAVDEKDAEALRRAAHTLKSNAATFGGSALAALCQELEALGEAGTVEGAGDLLARADAEHERVRSELEVLAGNR
jgi:PAS domain S-box-containing protein